MLRFSTTAWAPFVSLVTALVACGPETGGNGVNDVKAACEIRAGWSRVGTESCRTCRVSAVISPDCDCERDDVRGLCSPQVETKAEEVDCGFEIDQCVGGCREDCECIERCYDGHAACKTAQAALDGCVADVCDEDCR